MSVRTADELDGLVAEVMSRRPGWHSPGIRKVLSDCRPLVDFDTLRQVSLTAAIDHSATTPNVIRARIRKVTEARVTAVKEQPKVWLEFNPRDDRHCRRPGCECPHWIGECMVGFLDDKDHLDLAYPCPTCWGQPG